MSLTPAGMSKAALLEELPAGHWRVCTMVFTLKRAVDALEASSKATAGSSAIAVAPLLVLYAATRLGVSLANEVSADQYERRKISRVLVSPRNRCAAQALE